VRGLALARWRFLESEADGQLWLDHPAKTWAFIEVEGRGGASPRSIMVVTKGWVQAQLDGITRPPSSAVFAAMLVVPDGGPEQLRASIDAAMNNDGVRRFGADRASGAGAVYLAREAAGAVPVR
jgi:hypothetical protein